MLDLDVPTRRRLGRVNNGRDLLVATGLVVLLARGAGAGGVEAGGVGGALAGDVEVVGAVARGAAGVEVGDVPGQGWAGLALGEGFEGAGQGDGGEEGGGEDGGELHFDRVCICTDAQLYTELDIRNEKDSLNERWRMGEEKTKPYKEPAKKSALLNLLFRDNR